MTGGRGRVWELRLSRMVEILFTKKSQNLCGRSVDGIEDGRDEVLVNKLLWVVVVNARAALQDLSRL